MAILAAAIAFFTIFIPGFLIALALLRKQGFHIVEIGVIGFIFGLMALPTLTWLESYLMNSIHFFTFSLTLSYFNVLVLTIIGLALCFWQGVFKGFKQEYLPKKEPVTPESSHTKSAHWWVWILVLLLMLFTLMTRLQSMSTVTTFYEFDPYFDMMDTSYILTYGQQILLDPSAWPSVASGTNHRIEPIVPYLEAYWYDLAGGGNQSQLSTNLLSYVGGVYPPIVAALLVFVMFMLVYREYNAYLGLIAAGLTATMPVLFTTFVAGEQLVEPWGIFALFFFFAAYLFAIKNPKSTRLAIFAGIAFVANFLGAHYYTVTAGVFTAYILLQGIIDIYRGEMSKDFYRLNGIIIIIIAIFTAIYIPYSSTLQNRVPSVLGIPSTLSFPLVALLFVAVLDYGPKLLKKINLLYKEVDFKARLSWMAVIITIGILLILFSPLGSPVRGYINLSAKFTTPSSALFMTVQEYKPTGIAYNYGANGFGILGGLWLGNPSTQQGFDVLVYLISIAAFVIIAWSIIYRKNRIGVLYLAIGIPLMLAGFSEVKYLPHYGLALIMLFCVLVGEIIHLSNNNFKLKIEPDKEIQPHGDAQKGRRFIIYSIALFFFSSILAVLLILYVLATGTVKKKNYAYIMLAVFALTVLAGVAVNTPVYGESQSFVQAFSAWLTPGSPSQKCASINNAIGADLYCNTIPAYWLNAMAWIKSNIGPHAPRVLAWWDYGDWINWFGNSNAVLRGDNAVAKEDYATAAAYVLGPKYNYGPAALANYMNDNQSKYVLFDQDLISKWGALDFLGCINVNATSYQFAVAAGQASNPPTPYAIGTSQCEQAHDPQIALIPLAAVIPTNQSQNINYYCSISNNTAQFIQAYLTTGSSLSNQTVCVSSTPTQSGVFSIYNQTGKKLNAYLQASQVFGLTSIQGVPFVQFLMIYTPNGPNDTITNAPSEFYNSNYYKGFILGNLPGFTQVYPANATGINFVNGTYPVRIFALNNFTGALPPVPPKPSWIVNNYTIP